MKLWVVFTVSSSEEEFDRIFRKLRSMQKRVEDVVEDIIRREVRRLSEEIHSIEGLMRPMWHREGFLEPLYTIEDAGDKYIVYIDLPYTNEQKIDVKILNDKLMIRAQLKERVDLREWHKCYGETGFNEYRIVINLPSTVNPAGAKVDVKRNMLRVIIPKHTSE